VYLLPLPGTVLGGPPLGGPEVQHLIIDMLVYSARRVNVVQTEKVYLCGDNVKLEFLPVLVGLFESLNLSQNQNTDDWE